MRFPDALWAADGIAHVGFGERLSLTNFRLRSQGQTIAIDASKTGDYARRAPWRCSACAWRLLPHELVDPSLHLGGLIDADVHAGAGRHRCLSRTWLCASQLEGGRARSWSRVDAKRGRDAG